jgi:signal peptidase I
MKKKILITLGVVSTLSFLFLIFKYQHFSVPTSAMSLTINPDDIILVDKTLNTPKDIKRNDISVFYFPAGDTVVEEEPSRNYEQMIRDISQELNISNAEARKVIKRNYTVESRSLRSKMPYIKRIVGIAGDKLEIKNTQLFINDVIVEDSEKIQYNYKVTTDGTCFNEKILRKKKITYESLYHMPMDEYGSITMTLSIPAIEKLKAIPNVRSIDKIIKPKGYEYVFQSYPIFPNHKNYEWSIDNYGPLRIPKKGEKVKLTLNSLPLYEKIIKVYEQNELRIEGGRIFINDKPAPTYKFKMNYYWMMGDNRHNSVDSRYWGFVPEDHLIGELVRVLYSSMKE